MVSTFIRNRRIKQYRILGLYNVKRANWSLKLKNLISLILLIVTTLMVVCIVWLYNQYSYFPSKSDHLELDLLISLDHNTSISNKSIGVNYTQQTLVEQSVKNNTLQRPVHLNKSINNNQHQELIQSLYDAHSQQGQEVQKFQNNTHKGQEVIQRTNSLIRSESIIGHNKTVTASELINKPHFKARGGVIIFYHVAKTGGSTCREWFEWLREKSERKEIAQKIKYKRFGGVGISEKSADGTISGPGGNINHVKVSNECNLDPTYAEINYMNKFVMKRLLNNQYLGTTYLIEIHGANFGLKTLSLQLDRWRKMAEKKHKIFFAFSLVREPISFSSSYFKFYYRGHCDPNKFDFCESDSDLYKDPTEENIVLSTRANRQCFFLNHKSAIEGTHASFYDKCKVSMDDCTEMYSIMRKSLDWIGITENLSSETLPLMQELLQFKAAALDRFRIMKNTGNLFQSLSNKTISKLQSLNSYDQMIYDEVKKDYIYDL
jgi:hypothetical protein